MQHAQLMSHVDTDIVTRAELQVLPSPEVTPTFQAPRTRSEVSVRRNFGLGRLLFAPILFA